MKRPIHVAFIDPRIQNEQDIYEMLHLDDVENLKYELIFDNKSPDFIIVTELFYMDPSIRKKFEDLYNDQVVTIFIAGECVAPDLNLFDYAIAFGSYDKKDRVICHPYRNHFRIHLKDSVNRYAGNIESARQELEKKTGFCNFICSNPNGHKCREEIFCTINSYKKVDSLGAFLNNTGFRDGDGTGFWEKVRNSIYLKEKYKFTIAFENEISTGYTTEKIFMALEAHSIPIYWGNPEIGKIVNEKAIINCHQYQNFEEVLERVKEIDQNDALWCQIVSEPWMTKEQEEHERTQEEEYYDFWDRIFLEKHAAPSKRGSGTFADLYKNFLFGNTLEHEKNIAKVHLCMNWIRLHHQGKGMDSFFDGKRYKTVAVYGMADIGIAVYEEIQKCETVETVYGIDRGLPAIPEDKKCFRLYEVGEDLRPDAIVITVLQDQEAIVKEVTKRFPCDVYSVTEIVKTLLNGKDESL